MKGENKEEQIVDLIKLPAHAELEEPFSIISIYYIKLHEIKSTFTLVNIVGVDDIQRNVICLKLKDEDYKIINYPVK